MGRCEDSDVDNGGWRSVGGGCVTKALRMASSFGESGSSRKYFSAEG